MDEHQTVGARLATSFPECWETPATSPCMLPEYGTRALPFISSSYTGRQVLVARADSGFFLLGWGSPVAKAFKQIDALAKQLSALSAPEKQLASQELQQPEQRQQQAGTKTGKKERTGAASELARSLEELRAEVLQLISANEQKPDLEQLDREEYTLDMAEHVRGHCVSLVRPRIV